MQTESLYKEQSCGLYGAFDIEITVAASKLPDLTQRPIRDATYDAVKLIRSAVMAAVVQDNPNAMEQKRVERLELLALFNAPIFVEEIPNGYCPDWCCRHLPWFIVTTQIGRFKIGWRKRVILIDWSETIGTKTSDELFKAEDVTKDTHMIHAWNLENAKRYVESIVASACKSNNAP